MVKEFGRNVLDAENFEIMKKKGIVSTLRADLSKDIRRF